jgi:phage-related baseplate assembly protein
MKSHSQKKSRQKKSSAGARVMSDNVQRMLQLVAEKETINRTTRHGIADSLILAKNSKAYKPSGAGTFNRPK